MRGMRVGRFHLNDVDNEVISRDIVLLDIIAHTDPDTLGDIEFLWDVWYNMTLTRPHYDRLKLTLRRILDHGLTDSTHAAAAGRWSFGDHVTRTQARMLFY